MKISFKELVRFSFLLILVGVLSACGGSDSDGHDNDDDHDHEHAHGTLIVSQSGSNSLSIFDEGDLEPFEDTLSFTSATFVRADNGEFAAIKGGSEIQFVGEDGISEHSVMGSEVIATNGHFSILNAGSSTLVEVESLEEEALESESTIDLGLTEVYPAVVLDETEEVLLVFVSGEAQIYEAEQDTTESFDCTNPSSVAQVHHSAIVTCDEGVTLVMFEEDDAGITYEISALDFNESNSNYVWLSTGHVFAGYAPGTTNYALVHIEEDHSTEIIFSADSSASSLAYGLPAEICAAGIEPEDGDFLFLLSGGTFVALDSEAELINTIVLTDNSTSTTCSDYTMSVTAKSAFILDNDAMIFYEVDVDADSSVYHVHEDIDTVFSDIVDSVVLSHEEGEDGHGHNHE